MKCPKCDSENLENSRFCSSCGSRLTPPDGGDLAETKPMPAPRAHPAVGTTFAGRYHIIEELGRGGMGVVYKAEDTRLKRTVALKFLPPDLTRDPGTRQRFIHEAQAASSLDHPNICRIHEIEETSDHHIFISMSCYDGETLKERIVRGPLEVEEALRLAIQICEGLAKAHEKDIVHRDIKPGNIFVTRDGDAKLLDFGLAKLAGQTRLTRTGTTVGTIAYMSPEQAQGRSVDHRTDIWSTGVVLYELLTGAQPFKGEYEQAIIYSILNDEPQPVTSLREGIPAGLERIVEKALAKDPDERYQSIDEMLGDLIEIRRDSGYEGPARVPSRLRAARKRILRILIPAALATVLVVVFIVFKFKVFHIEIGPQGEALADQNSLAVMPFENMEDAQDTQRYGQMITALLTTNLSESEHMRVISRQRLRDILRFLEQDKTRETENVTASEVAERAGVNLILTGTILQTEPNPVVTSVISQGSSGEVLATQRVDGMPGQDIFSVVDKLSRAIRQDLSLPQDESFRPVKEVTTSSPEAYRYYLEGLDHTYTYSFKDAEESFTEALAYDSTFAMAHACRANAIYVLRFGRVTPEVMHEINKALEYCGNGSPYEQGWIRAHHAFLTGDDSTALAGFESVAEDFPGEKEVFKAIGYIYLYRLPDPEKALRAYEKTIELDPLNPNPYCQLTYLYDVVGDTAKSRWAIEKYIAVAPDNANAFGTLGDLFRTKNRLDEAIKAYERAIELDPRQYLMQLHLCYLYLYSGDYEKARACYRSLALEGDEAWARSWGRVGLALVETYRGRIDVALKVLEDGLIVDRMDELEDNDPLIDKHMLKARIHREKGECDLALAEAHTAIHMMRSKFPDWTLYGTIEQVQIAAQCHNYAVADSLVRYFKDNLEEESGPRMGAYLWALGIIELAKGNVDAALAHLERTVGEFGWTEDFRPRYFLSRARIEAGRPADAIEDLQWITNTCAEDKAYRSLTVVRAHYLLGIAYEATGQKDKAIEQYEKFVSIWADPDPVLLPEVEDARRRLAGLKTAS